MDQIDQVRQKTDIVELISSYIQIKKAGRNFKALCPFHSEKTPSFIISPERQIFKCFGCQAGGSVFNFLMLYEKMSFGEALRFLADKAGIKLTSFKPTEAQQEKEKLLAINHLASEFYHYILLNHKLGLKGLQYLRQRGISNSSIKLFKLGYAPENWENLANFLVKKKGYKLTDLEKTGLIIKGQRYYDRFRARIMFPLQDHRGNILGFSGRILKPDIKDLSAEAPSANVEAKYVNTPETAIYHKSELFYSLFQAKEAIKRQNEAVIVEGEFDVISSFQAGVKNVIATKGSALTENQVNLIKRFCQRIILSLDADLAGDDAIKRGVENADKAGLLVRVAQVKYGKDPDECSRHSPKLWKESVKKSIPVFDFYLKTALKRFDKNLAEGKKYISEEMVPLLAKIQNEVFKAHYLKKLANILDVDEAAVVKEISRFEKTITISAKPRVNDFTSKTEIKSRKERLEELLLSLLIQKKNLSPRLLEEIKTDYFSQPAVVKILLKLKKFLETNKELKINLFVKTLPLELVELFDRLYLQELDKILENGAFAKELKKTYIEIKKIYFKEKINKLVEKIRKFEKEGKSDKIKIYQEKFTKASQKIKALN